jgi:hypothetical protein
MKKKYLTITIFMALTLFLGCAWNSNILSATVNIYAWKDAKTREWGAINNKGEIVVKPQYGFMLVQSGYAIVDVGEKEGLINNSGKYILNPEYDQNSIASISGDKIKAGDLIKFSDNIKYGVANTNGKIIVQPKYDSIGNLSEGLITFGMNSSKGVLKYGYMNAAGKVVCPAKFDNAYSFSNGVAIVTIDSKDYIINKTFNNPKQLTYFTLGPFFNGVCVILDRTRSDALYGLMNSKGDVILKPKYKWISEFVGGLAIVVTTDNKYGYINTKGNIVVKPTFENASDFSEGLAYVTTKANKEVFQGFIDMTGKMVFRVKCKNAYSFVSGLCPVQVNDNSWGYINKSGKVLFTVKCNFAYPFYGDLAQITTGSELSEVIHYINKQGKIVK